MASTPTLPELEFSILNAVRSRATISEPITSEILRFYIKNVRSLLIKNDSNKNYTADSFIIQELQCVDVIQVDRGECCEVTGCTIYRTQQKIPSPIELHYKQLITRIGSIDKTQIPFDFIDYAMVPYISFSRWTKNRPKVFTMNNNGYFYFILPEGGNLEGLQKISIQGVFEDPTLASTFTNCEGQTCYNELITPYPIKGWMVPTLIDMVIKMFIKQQATAPSDQNNDGQFTIQSPIETKQ